MVSGAGGPMGSYGAYTPPMSSSERTVLEANQMFKQAMRSTDPRRNLAPSGSPSGGSVMAQPVAAQAAPTPPAAPPAEKGILGKAWDSVTGIFK